jgi:MFS transporter, FLVCR family, feline leukemia virus subgroup C receptor-related protein
MSSKSISTSGQLAVNVDGEHTVGGGERSTFRGDPWRFFVLGVYLVHSISNAMQWITYSPIVDEVKAFYRVDSKAVDMLSSIYLIAYVAIVFVSCKVFEVSGLKKGLAVASAFNAAGAALKLVTVYGPRSIQILYVSQALNSITQVFLIATPPLIASEWFLSRERTVATALMSNALNLGVAIGMLMPTLFVKPAHQSAGDFATLYWVEFAICAAPLIGTIFTPSAPKSAPSLAAARKHNNTIQHQSHHSAEEDPSSVSHRHCSGNDEDHGAETDPIAVPRNGAHDSPSVLGVFSTVRDSVTILATHREFVLLCIVCGLQVGVVWSMATVLPQVLKPFGITEGDAGWMGFLNLMTGAFAAPFVGSYVDRSQHYKPVLLGLMLLTLMCVGALMLGFQYMDTVTAEGQHHVFVMAMVLWSAAGLFQNALLPLFYEFGVELTFPHSESTTAPILAWAGSAFAIGLTQLFGFMLGDVSDAHDAMAVMIVCAVALGASTFVMMFITSDLRRHGFESLSVDQQH